MHTNKIRKLAEQAKELSARFVEGGKQMLGGVFTPRQLQELVEETVGAYRERSYGPLKTLQLFLEQVLGSDHSCRSAVAHGASRRAGRSSKGASLNTGPYCKARKDLVGNNFPNCCLEPVRAEPVEALAYCAQHFDRLSAN